MVIKFGLIMYKCNSELVSNVLIQMFVSNKSICILIILGSATVSILLEETMNLHIKLLRIKKKSILVEYYLS